LLVVFLGGEWRSLSNGSLLFHTRTGQIKPISDGLPSLSSLDGTWLNASTGSRMVIRPPTMRFDSGSDSGEAIHFCRVIDSGPTWYLIEQQRLPYYRHKPGYPTTHAYWSQSLAQFIEVLGPDSIEYNGVTYDREH